MLIKWNQREILGNEYSETAARYMGKGNKLAKLDPFIDNDGIISFNDWYIGERGDDGGKYAGLFWPAWKEYETTKNNGQRNIKGRILIDRETMVTIAGGIG